MVFIGNQDDKEIKYDKAILNRISRSTGHLKAVRRMVEDERDCSEVLIQLAAVKAELANTSKEILKRYVQDTIDDAVENKEPERIKEIGKAVDWFF
ncbi:metal-sensing transcriptional repressor [Blautia sp. HCP3S3_G3]|uniref:metal-sensing transcriptional repressor n=1 Tax=Blautia sp. HCP3S3_G3 TaxID=3438913 RepID=UPI003F89BC06